VWLLTLPVLAGVLLLVYLDFTYGQLFLGAANGMYGRIAWVFWQPTVYAFAIPALGIVGDIVPVFAQTRHKLHGAAMVLIGLLGAVSFGAWVQFGMAIDGDGAPATPWLYEAPWTVVSVLALLAVLGLLGLWARTMAAGRLKLTSPLIFALTSGALLLLGTAMGVGTVIADLDVVFTTWATGQMYAVLAGSLVAALGGVMFWAPKLYGTQLAEAPARLAATLLLLGTAVVAVTYAAGGVLDQPEWWLVFDPGTIDEVDTVETLNLVGAIGGVVVVAGGVLMVLTVLLGSLRRRTAPGDDPWNGHTLEWATSSPPPVGNFATLPEITSEAPVYDARHAALQQASAGDASKEESA
jgi:heme/copper-type cytochrome/quinol oxidase subunit 1